MKKLWIVLAVAASLSTAACGKPGAPPASKEKEGEHEAGGARTKDVEIAPEAAKEAGIETAVAGPALLRELLPLYGVIAPNAERMRSVSARFAGVVKTVTAHIGDAVTAGEVLATVESNDSLQTYPVTAPIAGAITAREVNPGETVGEKPLFTVADLSSVWVELSLFPGDRPRVKIGQNVRVKAVNGAATGSGRIVWVSMVGTADTQSVTARVLLDNRAHRWTPGLYVSGDVIVGEHPVPLAIQATAIQSIDGRNVVFVRGPRGFAARPVRVGRSDSDMVEILEGLKAGEAYVSVGSFLVKAELGKTGAADED